METSSEERDGFDSHINHGVHETHVLHGGGAEDHNTFEKCTKNPGHAQMMPVKDFTKFDLPTDCQDQDIVELLKATADLTVMVIVTLASTKRPDVWPKTQDAYPFHGTVKEVGDRTATGRLWNVEQISTDANERKCTCEKCRASCSNKKVAGRVWLCTATHVVFDSLEAKHTTCRLFYDSEQSPGVTLGPWTMREADVEEDRCLLTCATCDKALLDRLAALIAHRKELWWTVDKRYCASRDVHRLACIVSHPHGVSKRISVGRWHARKKVRGDCVTKYTYTTSTCPGSSGAYVYIIGCHDLVYPDHVHSEALCDGYNMSGTGRTMPF